MRQLTYEVIDGELAGSAVAVELVTGLLGEAVKRSYTTVSNTPGYHSHQSECSFILLGLINTLCQDYIKQQKLNAGDPQYQRLVTILSELSGHTNGWNCFEPGEIHYCINKGLIPANPESILGTVEHDKKITLLPKKDFDNIMVLATMLITHVAFPDESSRPSTGDAFMDLLADARDMCSEVYSVRMRIAQRTSSFTPSASNKLNFDL